MLIEQLDKDLDFALNKENLFFSHEEKMAALHRAQIELFCFYTGSTATYQNGRPVPRVSYQVTQFVSSALQPFMKTVDITGIPSGNVTAPADMAYPTAIKTVTDKKIVTVDDDKVADRLNSKVVPVTTDYPIVKITASGWKLYPTTLTSMRLDYLAVPQPPVYLTIIIPPEIEGGEPTIAFDSTNSIDVKWHMLQYNELLNRTLSILGLNVKDVVVMQAAQQNKAQGQ